MELMRMMFTDFYWTGRCAFEGSMLRRSFQGSVFQLGFILN